jgi:hypothetical protein
MWKVLAVFACLSSIGSDASQRLPNSTAPQAYAISLAFGDFDRGDMRFTGSVSITVDVAESTNTIALHCSVLVLNTTLTRLNYGGGDIAHTHDIDYERELLVIRTSEEELQRSSVVLVRVDYSGFIGTAQEGVFRGSYSNDDGSVRFAQSTHFKVGENSIKMEK